MRTLYSVLLMLVCGILGSTPSFAQNSQGYASELSKQIKESLEWLDRYLGPVAPARGPGT